MAPLSISALRRNLFGIIDEVIRTGVPAEIERNGHRVRIVLADRKSKLGNLSRRNCIPGDPDELIDLEVARWHEEDL